jgi:hypothetical protein
MVPTVCVARVAARVSLTCEGGLPVVFRRLIVASVLLLLAACGGEPTGPDSPAPAEPIALGDTVSADLSVAQATRTYILHAPVTDSLVLFGQATAGYVVVAVTDSIVDQDIAGLSLDGSAARPLLATYTRFQATAGRTYLFRVRGAQPGIGSFRLLVASVSGAPESRGPVATLDSVESGEALETGADIDEFSVTGQGGDELIAYLQALDDQPLESMILAVFDGASGSVLAAVRNVRADPDIQANASQRFVLPHDGSYRVVVHGEYGFTAPGRTDAGRYQFEVRHVTRAPEHAASAVAAGDTVSEILDYAGDVDEFTFPVEQGRLYDVFLQDLSSSPSDLVYADILRDGVGHASVGAEGGQELFRRGSGRFTAEGTGTETIRVYEVETSPGTRAYRLYVYAIDTLPETLPAAQTLNLALTGEALELPGDLDVFTLTVPQDTVIELAVAKAAPDSVQPVLSLLRAGSEDLLVSLYATGPGAGPDEVVGFSGKVLLAAGTYRLRIDGGEGWRDGYGGAYRVESWGLSDEPEGVPSAIAVGGVVNEALSPVGDEDHFRFNGTAGQLVDVTLTGTGQGGTESIAGWLMRSATGPSLVAETFASAAGGHTGRVHLPADGQYEMWVLPCCSGAPNPVTGFYQLALSAVDPAPEHLAATLAAGGGIQGESIDTPGDIDRFTVTAAPGSEFEIVARFASSQFYTRIQTLAATGDAPDRTGAMPGYDNPLGRFVFPASGKLRLQMYEERTGFDNGYTVTGGYTVTFVPINRAPETLAAAAPRNVVVQGERIDLIGDVDEFTFAGSAGEQIQAFFNTPHGIMTGGTLTMEVVEAATGTVLGSVESGNGAPDIHDQSTGLITLPSSGTYLVRVRGTLDTTGADQYEFLIGS